MQNRELVAFSDADYAGDRECYKSTSGQLVLYGGAPIGWKSKLQRLNVTSTTEAEYVSLASTIKMVLLLRELVKQLNIGVDRPTKIYCDNRGTVAIATNDASAQRTRHLGAQLFFTRDQQQRKNVDINWVQGNEQLADILTKPLNKEKYKLNINKIMAIIFCLMTIVSASKATPIKSQINFVSVNPIVWINMHKLINVGLHVHKHTLSIPDYCQEVKSRRLKMRNNTLTKMLERVENSCYVMRREVFLPNLHSLEGYKFKIDRFPRQANNNSIFGELNNIANQRPREGASGWDAFGAPIPLVGPMVQTLVQYNKEDSAYNTVWKTDREMKLAMKRIVNLNDQLAKQQSVNSNSSAAIGELNHATNILFSNLDLLEKASPEIADTISKITVNIYRDADLFRESWI